VLPDIFDQFPKPPCAELLGWHLIDADQGAGWIKIGFEARPEFRNPAGFVQGGFLAAMLDDTMGPAVLMKSNGRAYTATIDLRVSYLAPARIGAFVCEARVVQLGKTIAFAEAKLMDANGTLVATATTSARVVEASKLPGHKDVIPAGMGEGARTP
jgi:uncharacterized protein (TIGR00369 family)